MEFPVSSGEADEKGFQKQMFSKARGRVARLVPWGRLKMSVAQALQKARLLCG
jgi:hypothetical protein